ncbi:response regulator [Bacteriovorax sp. Seq25_V]|uniref:response regulator n=1 Tax=Bacteriovorax sp. Seq25_V TaxID=1201288 RepID=UPI00038A2692|nr:response regulator [Bacteriovorax sp. Seq25_V]EQC46153.1 response regulator receiver domain protein [Bacteriovorax sp. Seq25_V]
MEKFKLIIVDDEADLLELCTDIFEMEGHEAIGFTCPSEALAFIESGNSYDAIVSDATMPNISGLEFLEKIKTLPNYTEKPFILSTGRIDFDEAELNKLGVTKIIMKPFDISAVVGDIVGLIKAYKA